MAAEAATVPLTRSRSDPEVSWLADLVVVAFVTVATAVLYLWAHRALMPMTKAVAIDLSPWALPGYAVLSYTRVILSYVLSFLYTVIYGTIAARNARAERVMIPILDVLQGVPVLGFLPGVGLALIALFPHSNVGIELTCILMIFTAMPWNMAYSYYSSLRTIPEELESVARVHRFNWWRRFTQLELPIAMNGLVWNSMMSLAGGWFFLMILETFRLRNDATGRQELFVLPGIGSYIAEAYRVADWSAVAWALATMTAIVVLTDQLFWKPVVVWAQRFRFQDVEGNRPGEIWMGAMIARSHIASGLRSARAAVTEALAHEEGPGAPPLTGLAGILARSRLFGLSRRARTAVDAALARRAPREELGLGRVLGPLAAFAAVVLACWLTWQLFRQIRGLALEQWGRIFVALILTTCRLSAAVAIGALLMVPIGVLVGNSPRIARRAQPIVQVVASFPAPMFFPVISAALVRLFGVASFEWTCVVLTLFGTQWYILFNVIAGATALPPELQEAADAYRVKGRQRWRTLFVPGVMPYLVTGLFTAAGGAWNGAIVGEFQQLEGKELVANGIGAMISVATERGDYATLTGSVLALVLMIVLLNRFVWSRLHHWSEERFSMNA